MPNKIHKHGAAYEDERSKIIWLLSTQSYLWKNCDRYLSRTDKQLLELTKAQEFVSYLQSKYAVSTIATLFRSCINPAVNAAVSAGLITANPFKSINIPKPGKDEKRPLGIPIMHDRALQGVVKAALEPEWEAKFEASSYGFRPGRSCHDAIQHIKVAIQSKAKYVLDADIAKCFDRIDHLALLQKLKYKGKVRRQIKSWLKSGVIDQKVIGSYLYDTRVIEAIFISIRLKPKFVLDADISKCFDRIDHKKLLEKLNTYPTLRRQIRAWLKAGVMDGLELKPTDRGTPQGGTISPLLANIALHGMENVIKELAESFDMKRVNGTQLSKRDKRKSVNLIRYADDFVIFHEDIDILNRCIKVITQWLESMGLELKPSKTRIAHTLNNYRKEKAGFDVLGFNIRQHKTGKYTCGKNRKGLLGFKTIITPSKEAQNRHYRKLAEIIDHRKGQPQIVLIGRLNPVIRGWCNYYATVISQKVFWHLTYIVKYKLFKWGKKRHGNKGMKWVINKYFMTIGSRNWVFATRTRDNPFPTKLISHQDTEIKRFVKVKGDASPYDGNLVYWSTRQGKHPEMPTRTAFLLKKQKGKCNWCELYLKDGDVIELDHIIPKSKGGKDEYKNWQLLHRHCHDKKTSIDGSLDTPFKPVKLSPNWRWENDMLVVC